MIPYVEILTWNADQSALKASYLVEPSECWFEIAYNDLVDFEIYAPASELNLQALQKGNFAKIPHKSYVWYTTSIQYTYNADGGRMIIAKGKNALWLLTKRIIATPRQLSTALGTAVYTLVRTNMGEAAANWRKIKNLQTINNNLGVTIESTQAPRVNLADFVLELLKANNCGARMNITNNGALSFLPYVGVDRSAQVIFAQSLDNLISSSYFTSDEGKKNYCQVVSTQTENDVTQESVVEYPDTTTSHPYTGIDRDEMTLSSSVSTKYTDASGQEQETPFGSALYQGWQVEEGKNALAEHKTVVEFTGEIDLAHSQYEYGVDFAVGDIVKVRDEWFGFEQNVRITKYTFKQDRGGYQEIAEYGAV